MAIKIVVSNHIKFPVSGEFTNSEGVKEKFAFTLTAKRIDQDELNQAHADLVIAIAKSGNNGPVTEKVLDLVTDWGDVKDETLEPVAFSRDGLAQLLCAYQGLSLHVWRTYQDESGVKAKN